MYNIKIIEKIENAIQEDINSILNKWEPILNEKIKNQIKFTDKLISGMGVISIENNKDKEIAEEFSRYLSSFEYTNKFETSMVIKNINFKYKTNV